MAVARLVTFGAGGYPQGVVKGTFFYTFLALFFVSTAVAQGKSADALKKQIKDLKSDKVFTLTYDQGSDSSKLMAIAEGFGQREVDCSGARAINFAAAFTFITKTIVKEPETINLTFWVLTKKPQFAFDHHWTITGAGEPLDLGDARYAAKASENMEYLNFVLSRENLKRLSASGTTFRLGKCEFAFTLQQTKLLADMLALSKL